MCEQQGRPERSAEVPCGGRTLDRIVIGGSASKYSARERLALLLDQNSFYEIGAFVTSPPADSEAVQNACACRATFVGYGKVAGRWVGGAIGSQGFFTEALIGTDVCLAWLSAEITVPDAALVADESVQNSLDVSGHGKKGDAQRVDPFVECSTHAAKSYESAATGYADDVVQPLKTRSRLVAALEVLEDKQPIALQDNHRSMRRPRSHMAT